MYVLIDALGMFLQEMILVYLMQSKTYHACVPYKQRVVVSNVYLSYSSCALITRISFSSERFN